MDRASRSVSSDSISCTASRTSDLISCILPGPGAPDSDVVSCIFSGISDLVSCILPGPRTGDSDVISCRVSARDPPDSDSVSCRASRRSDLVSCTAPASGRPGSDVVSCGRRAAFVLLASSFSLDGTKYVSPRFRMFQPGKSTIPCAFLSVFPS